MNPATDGDSVLAVLENVSAESSALLVDCVIETAHVTGCYTFVPGPVSGTCGGNSIVSGVTRPRPVTVGEVNALACLLDAIAVSKQPRLRCVPLLDSAGWTLDRIAALPLVRVLLLLLLPTDHPCRDQPRAVEPQQPCTSCASEAPEPAGGRSGSIAPAEAQGDDVGCAIGPSETSAGEAGGGSARHGAAAVGAELERRRPSCLPAWVTRIVTVPAVGGAGGGGGGNGGGGSVAGVIVDHSVREGWPPAGAGAGAKEAVPGAQVLGGPSIALSAHSPTSYSAVPQPRQPPLPGSATSHPHPSSEVPQQQRRQQTQEQEQGQQEQPPGGCPPSSIATQPPPSALPSPLERYVTLVDGAPARPTTPLRFGRVAVGGTFDRLHAGHELLLAVTALVAEGFVFVGVTADALLANKSHRELLQPYDTRVREAVLYMQAVRPGLQVEGGPLSAPQAPTLAELDPAMEALVVSVETLPGAEAINAGRTARGFRPLTIITVPVIGLRRGDVGHGTASRTVSSGFSNKLSSSGLRALEAAAAEATLRLDVTSG